MGLVYHNGKFIPEENIQKSTEEARVLRLLRSFLDKNEPGLVKILVNTWRTQGEAITYKELREAILAGDISTEYMQEWMQDYSRMVKKYLLPAWEKAINAGVEDIAWKYPALNFNFMADGVRVWTEAHSAEFVTNVTSAQIEGLRSVVRRAAVIEDITVDELSRVIRPMIGLTKPQATANMNYYKTIRDNLLKNNPKMRVKTAEKRAKEAAMKYAARQHRSRAYTVARTELVTAYNSGAYEGTKQAQEAGLIGKTKKVWSTADDERVCPYCGSLDGKEVGMDEDFPGISSSWSTKKHPPAHPGCRCGVMFVEIEPPVF